MWLIFVLPMLKDQTCLNLWRMENSNCWTVTYTPYCGGGHKFTIKVENTSTHERKLPLVVDHQLILKLSLVQVIIMIMIVLLMEQWCNIVIHQTRFKLGSYRERIENTYARHCHFSNHTFYMDLSWGQNG